VLNKSQYIPQISPIIIVYFKFNRGDETLDYKDFFNGLISTALTLVMFSFSFIFSAIFLKSHINLSTQDRYLIVILCSVNLIFCIYYIYEVLNLKEIFKLENSNIIKFGKRIGSITLIYIFPFLVLSSFFFKELNNLALLMVCLTFIIEALVIVIVLKEVYDLVFLEEVRRDFEIEENRKKYIIKE
jgi:hypothetical protein